MESSKLKINVNVSNLRITLDIDREEEEIYRKAEKLFNEVLNKYQTKGELSMLKRQEILVYTGYHFAAWTAQMKMDTDIHPMEEMIERLSKKLDENLNID